MFHFSLLLQIQCITTIILTYLDGRTEGANTIVTGDTVQCYSCMSNDVQKAWKFLQDSYYPPLNFTDDCNHPFREKGIKTVVCSSMCVTLIEASYISGIPTGHNYFRGCLHRIARNGLNNSTLRQYGFEIFDLCDKVPRSSLYRNKLFAIDDHVMVCTCWGDKCNGARPNGAYNWTCNINSVALSIFILLIFNDFHGGTLYEKTTPLLTLFGCALLPIIYHRINSCYLR